MKRPRPPRAHFRVRFQLLRLQRRAGLDAMPLETFLELHAYTVRALSRKVSA